MASADGRRRRVALLGLGPLVFLHLIVFHNTARLTAVTGWPFPAALLFILLIDLLAPAVLERISAGAIVAGALLLIPAAHLAHGAGVGAAAAWVIGGVSLAVVAAAILTAQGQGTLRPGLGRTAVGWGAGMFVLVLAIFLYYIAYERRLPFENALILPVMAGIAALAALGTPRALRQPQNGTAPVPVRIPRAALLLVIPAALWIRTGPVQPAAGTGFPVRVMSFNLHQAIDIAGRHDLEAFARHMETSGAEVFAVQEVSRGWVISGSTEMLTWLSRRLRMAYVWSPAADASSGMRSYHGGPSPDATAWRFPEAPRRCGEGDYGPRSSWAGGRS